MTHLWKNTHVWPCVAGGIVIGATLAFLAQVPSQASKKEDGGPPEAQIDGTMELIYFDIPGKAEPVRLAAAYAGLKIKDTRISDEQFSTMKADGTLAYGQVPALLLPSGEVIVQSSSIVKLVGKQCGLYPRSDDLLCARIDSLLDGEIDLFTGITAARYPWRYGLGGLGFKGVRDKNCHLTKQFYKELNDVIIPKHLGFFEQILASSQTGWLAGTTEPTVIDFVLVPRIQWLIDPEVNSALDHNMLDSFPRLKALVNRMMSLKAIRDYYARRGVSWDKGSMIFTKVTN